MKRFLTGLLGGALIAVAANAQAGGTCAEVLASNSYDCEIVSQNGPTFTSCMSFTTPGILDDEIDVSVDAGGIILAGACSCGAKGSSYDVSSSFDCLTNASGEYVIFAGKASPGKIKKGHTTADGGFSTTYSCVQRETACP